MRVATPRALEFACHSAACRPPTSGGTGGSIARAQHVAPGEHAEAIMREGLRITPGWAARYGAGSYLGFEGDKQSAKFYAGLGRGRRHGTSKVITGDLKLDKPLIVSGRDTKAIRKDMITKLGGDEKVAEAMRQMYESDAARVRKIQDEELRVAPGEDPRAAWADVKVPGDSLYWKFEMGSVERMDQRIKAETLGRDEWVMSRMRNFSDPVKLRDSYNKSGSDQDSDLDMMLSTLAKSQGYDALVIHDTHGFTPAVGGSQIVLFDPAKFKPTGVKPVKEYVAGG